LLSPPKLLFRDSVPSRALQAVSACSSLEKKTRAQPVFEKTRGERKNKFGSKKKKARKEKGAPWRAFGACSLLLLFRRTRKPSLPLEFPSPSFSSWTPVTAPNDEKSEESSGSVASWGSCCWCVLLFWAQRQRRMKNERPRRKRK